MDNLFADLPTELPEQLVEVLARKNNNVRIERIVAAVEPFEFDRIYGAWWGKVVATDAKAAVKRSAKRYIRALHSD